MAFYNQIGQLLCDMFLLEQLLACGSDGISRDELTTMWSNHCANHGKEPHLSRSSFIRHMDNLRSLGFRIECRENKYSIRNAHVVGRNPVLSKLIDCLQDYMFLDQYRHLGDAIQPQHIVRGRKFLPVIGAAMENHNVLSVEYSPFGRQAYKALLHPYCLKVDQGRWYLLAYKEGNEHGVKAQVFALDRMPNVKLTESHFVLLLSAKHKESV